ncbi:MAG: LLM class flavin-dependent oxidoreductase [Proteobacteria bacterium]|nr:LLM class flavin-dependent oxidoreductase [Pseudomonadota bacterium]
MQVEFGWVLPYGKHPILQEKPTSYLTHVERLIDSLEGFHSFWMPDHFMDNQIDVPESMTLLIFLAGQYQTFQFGPIVLSQSYRNPALLAKMAATLQQLSNGRFVLGIGAGWKEDEYRAYGYDYPPAPTRIAQMAEVMQICQAMWDPAQPEASFEGEHYQIENAVCNPKPDPPPPIMVGGAGEKLTLRVVAEHADWWNLVGVSSEVYAHKIDVLERYCIAVGRDPATVRKTWLGVVSIAPTRVQAEEQMSGHPIWPGDVPLVGTPEEIADQLQQYVDLGVNLFQLSFVDEPELDGIALFINEVLPRWR